MRRRIISGKYRKKAVCIILVITMICSLFVLDVGVLDDDNVASAFSLPVTIAPGVDLIGKVSDLDTSNFTFSNTPNVNSGPALNPIANIFLNTPRNDGRIWTDKSVNATQAFIYDAAGSVVDTVQASADEFLVTLSALSQSVNVENIIVEPSDTVFIIDVSGSMASNTVPGDGRSRVSVVIDALNDAINMLMKADPNNRVSVAIYGGQSVTGQNQARVFEILPIGRYEIANPIFRVSGTNVTVDSAAAVPSFPSTFSVEGGTPTQLGIRRGGQILLDVDNTPATEGGTQIDLGDPGSPLWITRKPNIILMTDGEPTFAWTDYRMDSYSDLQGNTYTYNVGNGSAGDMGLTALTVMTASYVKQLVRDHYYPAEPTRTVGFYTLGLGVNTTIANAMLSPYGISAGGVPNAQLVTQASGGTTYNMLSILNNFVTSPGYSSGSFPYLQKPPLSGLSSTSAINNTPTLGFVSTCNYDTMSFTAMDKQGLDDAFSQITQQIVTQGNYSTITTGNPQYDGYLVFSDVIGEYMEFKNFVGLWYNNVQNDGASFRSAVAPGTPAPSTPAAAIFDSYVADLQHFITKPGLAPGNVFTQPEALSLVASSRAGGALNPSTNGNKVVYYADQDRNFVSNFYDPGGAPVTDATAIGLGAYAKVELYTVQGPAVDALDVATPTDLMIIVFQVITVIEAGDFVNFKSDGTNLVSPLLPGDQIVRWYIPASLIPLRGVKQVFNTDGSPQKDDFNFDVVQVSEAAPLRVIYSVTPNVSKISNGLTAMYSNANKSPSINGYYFYSNRWRGMDGTVNRAAGDLGNMSQAFFEPLFTPGGPDNFYQQVLTDSTIVKSPNVTGPTGTSPWQWLNTSFPLPPASRVQVQRLGNNGRLELQIQTTLRLFKIFNVDGVFGYPPNAMTPLTFLVIGRDSNGVEIFRTTVSFSDPGITRDPLGFYWIDIQVPPGTYTFYEAGGAALGYIFTPPMPGGTVIPPPIIPPPPPPITPPGMPYTGYDNEYTLDPYHQTGLWLYKIFNGLLPTEVPSGFKFILTGPNGFYEEFTLAQLMPDGALTNVTEPGWYTLTEESQNVPGFNLVVDPPLPYTFEVVQDDLDNGRMITIENTYSRPIHKIEIIKDVLPDPLEIEVIDDFGDTVIVEVEPVDLAFKIEGKDRTVEEYNVPAGSGWSTTSLVTVRYTDLINGRYVINDLPSGTYTITEIAGEIPGFTGPVVNFSITPNTNPPYKGPNPDRTPNSYAFLFDEINDVELEVTFTNRYNVPPPPPRPRPPTETPDEPPPVVPPGPSPQTGDGRSIFIPIAVLTFGGLFIAGAEVYRIRHRRARRRQ